MQLDLAQGYSVFTTLLMKDHQPQHLDLHLDRLKQHAAALSIAYPGDETLKKAILQLPHTQAMQRLRLTLLPTEHTVTLTPFTPPTKHDYEGVRVHVSGYQVHPQLAHFKTGCYLPYRLAHLEAQAQRAFEGLLCDAQGHVVDGSRSSLIQVLGNTMVLAAGGLLGITRALVAEQATKTGFEVQKQQVSRDQLSIGQWLLAGTGIGLVPVGAPSDTRIKELIERFRLA